MNTNYYKGDYKKRKEITDACKSCDQSLYQNNQDKILRTVKIKWKEHLKKKDKSWQGKNNNDWKEHLRCVHEQAAMGGLLTRHSISAL